jgi:hypothetical protein
VKVGNAVLSESKLSGKCSKSNSSIDWNLSYSSRHSPLFLLPVEKYFGDFPKAKSLVGHPLAKYNGVITVNGEEFQIDNWIGSQNHKYIHFNSLATLSKYCTVMAANTLIVMHGVKWLVLITTVMHF